MKVDEARRYLTNSVLHVAEDEFGRDKIDDALHSAFQEFLRRSESQRSLVTITTADGTGSYDLTSLDDSTFLPQQIVGCPYITTSGSSQYRMVPERGWEEVRDLLEQHNGQTGTPEILGFPGNAATAEFFPVPDGIYAVQVPIWEDLELWTPGVRGTWSSTTAYKIGDVVKGDGDPDAITYRCVAANAASEPNGATNANWLQISTVGSTEHDPSAITINCPEHYCREVIRWGVRRDMLIGAPGHPDDQAASFLFRELCNEARKQAHRPSGRYVKRSRGRSASYGTRARPI